VAVFDIDAGRAVGFGGETDFDFAADRGVWFELPERTNQPGEDEALRRLPFGNGAPGAVITIFLLTLTAASDMAFDDRLRHGRFAYVVTARPPTVEAFGKNPEGVLLRCSDSD
jgi:hypothetical protein